MSRSIKYPGYTDRGKKRTKFYKRCSNKKTRKDWNISNGSSYKKNGYPYEICDWKCIYHSPFDFYNEFTGEWYDDKRIYRAFMK